MTPHQCANHVAAGSIGNANIGLEQINHLESADGDTMQGIATYFTKALANRMLKGWPGLYKAINSTKITSVSEDILVKRLFFDLFPFLRLSYLITDQAILEAMEGEKMVHIIDLCFLEPAQWMNLIQSLSTHPEGPQHLRITGIHQQKEVLEQMALRLNEEADRLDIPFQFNPLVSRLDNLEIEALCYKSGEALAISSDIQEAHASQTVVKASIDKHILVGGGCTLLHLGAKIDIIIEPLDNDEHRVETDIVKRPFGYLFKLIAKILCINDPSPAFQERTQSKSAERVEPPLPAHSVRSRRTPT
ncbi:scarecrow-like protein 3 [Tanacetum coccineum]